jgi:hypothetical protein
MVFNSYRRTDKLLILAIFCFFLLALVGYPESTKGNKFEDSITDGLEPDISPLRYKRDVFDTVYTEKKMIIEVLLDRQRVLLHQRGKNTDTMLCSTGNDFIKDGIKTNRGIFIVKNKIPILVSKQFNNTKCLNWVGFNFGIGFHSLERKGYYWSLGKRPSSHGCIRLSQENAEKLFREVELETPIIIHKSDNARVICFLPETQSYDTNYTKREIRQILKDRLSLLYDKKYYSRKYPAIVLTNKYIGHDGIDTGERERVPKYQFIPPLSGISSNYYLRSDMTTTYIEKPDSLNRTKYPLDDSTKTY